VFTPPARIGSITTLTPLQDTEDTDLARTNLGTYLTRLDLGRLIKPMQAVGRRSDKPTNL
jgi:hypothetical protein